MDGAALRSIGLAVLVFAVAFAATPFAITGVFRAFQWVPTSAPFVAFLVLGVVVGRAKPTLRPAAAGVVVGTVAHGAFVWWLFTAMDAMPD
jgi:hypothetical protein